MSTKVLAYILLFATFILADAFKDIDWDTVFIEYTIVGSPRSDTTVTLTGRNARSHAKGQWLLLSSRLQREYKSYYVQSRDEYQQWKLEQSIKGNSPSPQSAPQPSNSYKSEHLYLDEEYNESTLYPDEGYNESELYPE